MPPSFCSSCGLQAAELRMELCPQCRWKREHKCMVKGCKTPASKVNLKKIPGRLTQATEAVEKKILSQFGMTSDVSQCCKACFIKLHRATTEFANAQQEVICKKGRPSVPYEHASTKTKTRIEKKAMELFHDNINTLKESYNQISGGCGSTLLDITLKAANIPTVAKISEVKAIFFFSQYLIRVPSLRKPSPLGRGLYLTPEKTVLEQTALLILQQLFQVEEIIYTLQFRLVQFRYPI